MTALPPRYEGLERIATGGMSDVFRTTDTHLARTVAVKLLAVRFCGDGDAQRRFVREGRAAARLSGDPRTVTIFDVGEWAGRPYIVMEYLPGGSLADLLRRGEHVPERQALRWLADAGLALDHAHARGVIHRDVKPANLLLDAGGEVVVGDYGIATAVGLESVTLTGTVLGTAGYLAPEQAQGLPASAASDRYSLAVVAYELLTGSRPFNGTSLAAGALAQLHEPLPAASERNPRLPASVDRCSIAPSPSTRRLASRPAPCSSRSCAGRLSRPRLARMPNRPSCCHVGQDMRGVLLRSSRCWACSASPGCWPPRGLVEDTAGRQRRPRRRAHVSAAADEPSSRSLLRPVRAWRAGQGPWPRRGRAVSRQVSRTETRVPRQDVAREEVGRCWS